MSSANTTQVAGTHYRSGYQHWDLVADTGMGYFEGQITKYVTRHRSKNKLQDLQKASHFLQKLTELAVSRGWHCVSKSTELQKLVDYERHNKLNALESLVVRAVVHWWTVGDLEYAALLLAQLTEQCYPAPAPRPRLLDDGPDYSKAE